MKHADILIWYARKPSDTNPIKSNISSKTTRGKKNCTKRHHHRHHQRQPGEQHFPIELVRASLTFNNYFYLFLYLYITRIIIKNNTPHLKSPRGGGGGGLTSLRLTNPRPSFCFGSQTLSCLVLWKIPSS